MTPKQKEHLEIFKELGFSVNRLTYEELVSVLLDKYIEVSMSLEYDEEQRFRFELKRIQKPTN